jgi:hypothetical protein
MTILVRLFEKLTGKPHQHRNAQKVAAAVGDLRRDVSALSSRLRPHAEADDPLVALMTDVFNQRQLRNGRS